MRQLLVINPNTSASVTSLLQTHISQAAGPEVAVYSVTARFGAPYIACEASYAVAGHAALDAWAAWLQADDPGVPGTKNSPDAVLIGCFGDPGLFALRDSSAAPVTGLAEAAFTEASVFGRFAVVTGGERWKPMLHRLAMALGHGDRLAGVHTVAPSGAELAADPAGARALLAKACRDAVQLWKVDAIVLGGAGLAGMAAGIQQQFEVPVIDSVLAGSRQARLMMDAPSATLMASSGFDVSWSGVSGEMMQLGR